jgi:hypothetical protein
MRTPLAAQFLDFTMQNYISTVVHVCPEYPSLLQHDFQHSLRALFEGGGECHAKAVSTIMEKKVASQYSYLDRYPEKLADKSWDNTGCAFSIKTARH